jgi:hypothetical protein
MYLAVIYPNVKNLFLFCFSQQNTTQNTFGLSVSVAHRLSEGERKLFDVKKFKKKVSLLCHGKKIHFFWRVKMTIGAALKSLLPNVNKLCSFFVKVIKYSGLPPSY